MKKFKLFSYLLIQGMLFNGVSYGTPNNLSTENQSSEEFIEIADPTYDTAFKNLMRNIFSYDSNPEIASYGVNVLNELLADDLTTLNLKIIRVDFDNDTLNMSSANSDENGINKVIFDVRLKCTCTPINTSKGQSSDNSSIIIEMQRRRETFYIDRTFAYAAINTTTNSKHGVTKTKSSDTQKPSKARFGNVATTFVISFLNHTLKEYENSGAIFRTKVMTDGVFEENTDSKEIIANGTPHAYFIQLPKVYEKIKEDAEKYPENVKQLLQIMTFQQAAQKGEDDITENNGIITVPKIYYENNEIMQRMLDTLNEISKDTLFLQDVKDTLSAEKKLDDILKTQRQQGREEGKAEGLQQGREEGRDNANKEAIRKRLNRATLTNIDAIRDELLEDYEKTYRDFIDTETASKKLKLEQDQDSQSKNN